MFDERELRNQVAADEAIQLIERMRPSLCYAPSVPTPEDPYGGQLYFHRSTHPVRVLVPGNGWGKSAAMGHEANAWATHSNRWQITPRWPVSMIWFGPGLSQWQKLRKELLEPNCFDQPYQYKVGDHTYEWRDGSRLEFRSYEAGWSVEQGVNPDIVFFDELPPWDLFREMEMRRRGKRKTRYVIAATQTMGTSWMEEVLYLRWLDHHKTQGLDEDAAMRVQTHDYIWCWPRGGIRSNPGMTSEDHKHYEQNIVYSSEAERRVRLGGGFGDWSGAAVFDLGGVRWMQDRAKLLVPVVANGSIIEDRRAA